MTTRGQPYFRRLNSLLCYAVSLGNRALSARQFARADHFAKKCQRLADAYEAHRRIRNAS